MKPKIALKMLYRSPVRTILTFILLVAVTFTLFSQILEHAVTVREIKKAEEQYNGIGAIEVSPAKLNGNGKSPNTLSINYAVTDPRIGIDDILSAFINYAPHYEFLTQTQIDYVSELPYVSYTDTRYMTAGVSNEYWRIDEGQYYYNYNATCMIEATFEFAAIQMETEDKIDYLLRFTDPTLVAGHLNHALDDRIDVLYMEKDFITFSSTGNERIHYISMPTDEDDVVLADSLEPGNRYVFLIRYEPLLQHPDTTYMFGDYFFEREIEVLWDVSNAPDYLESDEFSEIKRIADLIALNNHTFDVVYTDDLSSVMRFANGSMEIIEGRAITTEDSEINPCVCVISREFAIENNLTIGSTININLGDKLFEQFKGLGAIPIVFERVSENYTEVELEIIGIYADTDSTSQQAWNANWAYSINTFFVPKALLNVSDVELANHSFAPGEVSFVVENAWDIPVFLEECEPLIENLGVTLMFSDQGWEDVVEGFTATKELGFTKISVLAMTVVVASWFVSLLYINGRKKDYAVMRVLGTSKQKSNQAMLLPYMVLVIIAVTISAITAHIHTQLTIAESNSLVLLSGFDIDTNIPFGVVVLCVIGAVFLAFALAYAMLFKLGKKAPLMLLNDSTNKKKRKKKHKVVKIVEEDLSTIRYTEKLQIEKLQKSHKYAKRFVWKYVFRHIKRVFAKSLLTVVLCVLLINVIGQLQIMIRTYTGLVESTQIASYYVGGFQLGKVRSLTSSEYINGVYYETSNHIDVNTIETRLILTNDIEKYCGYKVEITYLEGYEEICFDKLNSSVVISKSFSEAKGLGLGDVVRLSHLHFYENLCTGKVAQYRYENPGTELSNYEIISIYADEIDENYLTNSTEFVVAGIFEINDETYSGEYDNAVISPGSLVQSSDFGVTTQLEMVEAVVADNELLDEYREFGQKLAGGSVTEGVMFVMDTSKLENLRNTLRLVEMLYPIAVVVTLVIGAFLCGLIIVQTSKDIAIMRVLGTSKAKTRTILVLEQMILCVIGIIIAGIVLYIRGALIQMLWVFGAYALVILLASIVASAAASRKNVLELLQTKE